MQRNAAWKSGRRGWNEAPPPGACVCAAGGSAQSYSVMSGLSTRYTPDPGIPHPGIPHPGYPRPQRPAQQPRRLKRARPRGCIPPHPQAIPTPPPALRACAAPLPDVPRAPRAPRPPPGTPLRPARPPRACSSPAGLRDPRRGAVLLRRPSPWTCTPLTGWGCPAPGPPAAPAAGRLLSGTRGQGRRGAAGRGMRAVGVPRRLPPQGVARHGFLADESSGRLLEERPPRPPSGAICRDPWGCAIDITQWFPVKTPHVTSPQP